MNRWIIDRLTTHILTILLLIVAIDVGAENMHAYNAPDDISQIDVQAVYYINADAQPLPDWKERLEYHLKRCKKFHQRELTGQSDFDYTIYPKPFVSSATPGGLPKNDVNDFYWYIINDVWHSGKIQFDPKAFPIVLVFSDMNFSAGYDDWTRESDGENCLFDPPHEDCRGFVTGDGEDRPGTRCGGARSLFWPEKHIGLGLVTADGWRVPIKGTDCVAYHEGIGHALGLPHPEPLNNSVMGLAQYVDSIQKAWIDEDQKEKLGWTKEEIDYSSLFSNFEVYHEPKKPEANQPVTIKAKIPNHFRVEWIKAEYQTELMQPFQTICEIQTNINETDVIYSWKVPAQEFGQSIGYRVRIEVESGETEEIWNFYKIRGSQP